MLFNGYHIYAIFFILASVVSADFAADRIEFTNKMKKTMKMQTNELQGEISTYWNNYPQCSRQCKIDVYKSGISGCFLTNTCLCRNAFWLEATARCVKGRCGNEELLATAHETWRACEKWGGPISLSEDEYIGAGFGVERAPQDSATTATASNGGDGGADSSGNSSNSVGKSSSQYKSSLSHLYKQSSNYL